MDKDLINPIRKIPVGCCPLCLTNLTVIDSEIVEFQLDDEGYPIQHESLYYKTYAKCKKCGTNVEMMKIGMQYKPYSKLVSILNEEKAINIQRENNPFIVI